MGLHSHEPRSARRVGVCRNCKTGAPVCGPVLYCSCEVNKAHSITTEQEGNLEHLKW